MPYSNCSLKRRECCGPCQAMHQITDMRRHDTRDLIRIHEISHTTRRRISELRNALPEDRGSSNAARRMHHRHSPTTSHTACSHRLQHTSGRCLEDDDTFPRCIPHRSSMPDHWAAPPPHDRYYSRTALPGHNPKVLRTAGRAAPVCTSFLLEFQYTANRRYTSMDPDSCMALRQVQDRAQPFGRCFAPTHTHDHHRACRSFLDPADTSRRLDTLNSSAHLDARAAKRDGESSSAGAGAVRDQD